MKICGGYVSQHVVTCVSMKIDGLHLRASCLDLSVAKEGSLRLPEAGRDTGLLEHKCSRLQRPPRFSYVTDPFAAPEASPGARV